MSDAELLEQTAEWLSRLAETIERVTERLADSMSEIKADQERQDDALLALEGRVLALHRQLLQHAEQLNNRDRR